MRSFSGFTDQDFDVFAIPTLEGRMDGIRKLVQPKLEALGQDLAGPLAGLTGHPLYPITAKHMRRKVNPPSDTWVAWSGNKRGYKMLPHFQVGLWHSHAFIQAGVIYEAQGRAEFARALLERLPEIRQAIPGHYRWLEDYTRPEGILHQEMTDEDFRRITDRLVSRKEADCMVGLSVDRAEAVRAGAAFAETALAVMRQVLPVYTLATAAVRL
ncbi:MAG: DUF1054 domain-containing protein [Bacillota bacterium]